MVRRLVIFTHQYCMYPSGRVGQNKSVSLPHGIAAWASGDEWHALILEFGADNWKPKLYLVARNHFFFNWETRARRYQSSVHIISNLICWADYDPSSKLKRIRFWQRLEDGISTWKIRCRWWFLQTVRPLIYFQWRDQKNMRQASPPLGDDVERGLD